MGRTLFVPEKGKSVFEVEFQIKRRNRKYNIKPLKIDGKVRKNLGAVNKPGEPKIYVVIKDNRIIYIGGTRGDLRKRLYPSLNHKKYPYEWRDLDGVLKLVLFVLSPEYDNQEASGRIPKGIEAFEGELVYMVRQSGRWPDYQTEIHFHSTQEVTRDSARAIARYLINEGLAENIDVDLYA